MESLPLKELDFGLQKRTGPSSGVVASIVLVSPGLECPGVSLVEVCATCRGVTCGSLVIEVQYRRRWLLKELGHHINSKCTIYITIQVTAPTIL